MATLTATAASSTRPARANLGHNSVVSKYTVSASLSAGDVIQMVRVPSGANIINLQLSGGSGACAVSVGDGAAATRYLASTSASAALVKTECNALAGHGYSYSAEDTIDLLVDSVATGTATGLFTLTVDYTLDP